MNSHSTGPILYTLLNTVPTVSDSVVIAGSINVMPGNGTNEFYKPMDVLVESNGAMYVTDRSNNRMQF